MSGPTSASSSERSASRSCRGSLSPVTRASVRSLSTSSSLASAPTSASSNVSSTSSQSASDSWSFARMLNRALPNGLLDLLSRSRSRCSRLFLPAGFSICSAGGVGTSSTTARSSTTDSACADSSPGTSSAAASFGGVWDSRSRSCASSSAREIAGSSASIFSSLVGSAGLPPEDCRAPLSAGSFACSCASRSSCSACARSAARRASAAAFACSVDLLIALRRERPMSQLPIISATAMTAMITMA